MEWIKSIGKFFSDLFSTVIDWFVNGINAIIGGIADMIFGFLHSCGLNIVIPTDVYYVLKEITVGIGYIIPVRALLPIPMFFIAFYVVKWVFAIYQLIAGTVIKRVRLRL